jgi:hypothetical protein
MYKMLQLVFLASLLSICGCAEETRTGADMVFINARAYTLDEGTAGMAMDSLSTQLRPLFFCPAPCPPDNAGLKRNSGR